MVRLSPVRRNLAAEVVSKRRGAMTGNILNGTGLKVDRVDVRALVVR